MTRDEELKIQAQSWAEAAIELTRRKDEYDAAEQAMGKAKIKLDIIEKELATCVGPRIRRKIFNVEGEQVVIVDYRSEHVNSVTLEEVV